MDNWIKVKRTTEDMDALVQDFTDVLKDFGITVDTDRFGETLASAEDVDLYITITDELDETRQKMSLMDYSVLPNAELEKLFDAIDALEDMFLYVTCPTCGKCEGQSVDEPRRHLTGFTFHEETEKDEYDYAWFTCDECETVADTITEPQDKNAVADVREILNNLTLLIPWADDWKNTKKMAEGTGE